MDCRRFAALLLMLVVGAPVSACQPAAMTEPAAATPAPEHHLLFIGDSYTGMFRGRLEEHLAALAASRTPPLAVEAAKVVAGGASLEDHWRGAEAGPAIQAGGWTVVVLQDDLEYYAWDEAPFFENHRRFHAEIQQAGAETVLFLSWKREDTDPKRVAEMEAAYAEIGAELGATIAPVGPAWRRALAERPGLDLYAPDRSHAGIAGAYLSLSVLYATLWGESPEGLPYLPSALIGAEDYPDFAAWKANEADNTAFLQRIAWETVVDYQPAAR